MEPTDALMSERISVSFAGQYLEKSQGCPHFFSLTYFRSALYVLNLELDKYRTCSLMTFQIQLK